MRRLMVAMASMTALAAPAMASDLYYPPYERDVYVDRAPIVERERIIERRYYRAPIERTYVVPRVYEYDRSYYDTAYDYPRPYPYVRRYWRHRAVW